MGADRSEGGNMNGSGFDDAPTVRVLVQPGQVSRTHPQRREDSLWDPCDVATFLRVSRSWVYQKAEAGLLPVIRMPGSALLRFDPDTMRAYARGEWQPPKNLVVSARRVRNK
jgi:hypothetical protein